MEKNIKLYDVNSDHDILKKHDSDLLFDAAVQFFNSGGVENNKTAFRMLMTLIDRDPEYTSDNNDNPYFYVGSLLMEDGDKKFHDDAIGFFTKAIEMDPNDCGAYEKRGYCWYDKGEYKKALNDLKYAEEIDDGSIVVDDKILEECEKILK
jgi:tetratricopeptide (TPR) repeat protein